MNACNPDKLTAFVDGVLGGAEARRMEAHLAECADCANLAREHAAIKRRMRERAAIITVPAGLSSRIGTALDQAPAPVHTLRIPRWRGPGLPLAVATLVATTGLWLSRPMWQTPPVNVQALMWHHRDAMNPPRNNSIRTGDRAVAGQWIYRRLEDSSRAPALPLPLNGVGVCRVDDAPAALWMYRAERPVTLIEIYRKEAPPDWAPEPGNSREPGLRVGSYGGYNAVIWQANGHTFALVSDLPADRLVRLVEKGS